MLEVWRAPRWVLCTWGMGVSAPAAAHGARQFCLSSGGKRVERGPRGSTEPEQWKNRMRQLTYNIPAIGLEAKAASLSGWNSLSLLSL